MTYTLTDAGWPRPRSDETSATPGMPVPWVAPQEHLGEMNEGRRLATLGGAICNVCGEGYRSDEVAYGFTCFSFNGEKMMRDQIPLSYGDVITDLKPIADSAALTFLDSAVMHWRCARLAATMCPHIVKRSDLICVEVPANDGNPEMIDGKLTLTYPAKDCVYNPWPINTP